MSITDELREWASVEVPYKYGHQLTAIADRIDEEHERAVAAAHSNGITEYGSMVAHEYVKLPVDADGEVIHIGDRVENNERVVRIVLTDGSWEPSVYVEKRPNVLREYFCNEISHYHELTVEDVLREFFSRYVTTKETKAEDDAILAEYAARLQLRSDAEVVE